MRLVFWAIAWLVVLVAAPARPAEPWRDPSTHKIERVTVESGVELEVLDWGGAGAPIVLLAGLGNSAHVFDGFAERLTARYRVLGISRRGMGNSTIPVAGYTVDRLADDILAVVDALDVRRPILMGHSIANEEMNSFAKRYPFRAAALVYLDAATDRTKPGRNAHLQELGRSVPPPDPPTAEDSIDFKSFSRWAAAARGVAFPEGELRQCCRWAEDGRMLGPDVNPARDKAIQLTASAVAKPDYATIRVPALAIFAIPMSGKDIPGYRPEYADAFEKAYKAMDTMAKIRQFGSEVRQNKVVELPSANHYVFLSNPDDVERALEEFAHSFPQAFRN